MAGPDYRSLWLGLVGALDAWDAKWRSLINSAPPAFASGLGSADHLSDAIVFEAFAVAMLSGNTRWDRIANIRDQLAAAFCDFDPPKYADLSDRDIEQDLVPWFSARRAGSAGLRDGLLRLRRTASILAGRAEFASANELIHAAFAAADHSAEQLAMLLGNSPRWKLPGFGIALASEALRLLGFDLCKPDRHVLRAVGSWDVVHFARWERKGAFTPPQARPPELLATMLAVRSLADANRLGVSYTNSAIWLAGAVSGARLTNADFAAIC